MVWSRTKSAYMYRKTKLFSYFSTVGTQKNSSFEHPKHMINPMGREIFTMLRSKDLFYLNLWSAKKIFKD